LRSATESGKRTRNESRGKFSNGRSFSNNSADCVAVGFYENKAAVLIKEFSLYVILTRKTPKDYYEVMQRSQNDSEENV
jgi:hypothetical protein